MVLMGVERAFAMRLNLGKFDLVRHHPKTKISMFRGADREVGLVQS
jgi:hypothetical protein